ncbi:ABC transporter substrate-binding protein [Ornithinicoccus hortensis]|uniref:Amino acid/amide ABC transporter substrate-binding protein (HAAT family) n=1 Tax=Ornithinicoccus hortensis TaxID=82346 RepID=A0A542YU30_9MICO|nr:ABC transporter substrate-binding protein [Ornithinicoccus hortensis]TQL51600.1 amino acid/amide ABC transporter substrate-binding protein (HAAT family) [Ornithinicoccus hortensis]
MTARRSTSRRLSAAAAVCSATLLLAACGGGGGSLGGDDEVAAGPVKIGLLVPQSGVYKSLGDDMKAGFEVYLEQHDNMLGGREVEVVLADEGETADSGKSAADKLVKQDGVLAVTGVVSSAVLNGVVDLFESEGVPLVGSNASPTTLTDAEYIWRTSYVNDEPGKALGAYAAEQEDGPVYLLAADYQAGLDETTGFKETFEPAGGEIADEVYTPFPDTSNFQPFLSNLQSSGAGAVFTFYAGGAAVEFVKQYDQFGLAGEITHYSAGFLTEGSVLDGQGDSALGTLTAMNYSADLDNEVNEAFVADYQEKTGMLPTTYAAASYDAAAVLDKAIEASGDDLSSESLNAAIGEVGEIDSPRGTWEFNDNGTPIQMWYLREVQEVDGELRNVVVEELGTLGD